MPNHETYLAQELVVLVLWYGSTEAHDSCISQVHIDTVDGIISNFLAHLHILALGWGKHYLCDLIYVALDINFPYLVLRTES